mmetsp:Transcript_42598/g.166327  ORF Transcript_42598/g.166327 Transcript_42598/m.166327 type:complete len:326 (-) Transcript_42598:860-1837(-)|eukprot:CAMPEP_0113956866 /NCGR_PEP_ID=MMETSP0011_2-20120614/2344_1 /TAXON_ID=101924 /ORGANISM="Rhodosorus marinus" /LENGTH=325 /DNA_ID=CAMNT_0000967149 /DNA_START=169 /DNA_END=1146 /DNA_ORIENTATION=+ /assembly_acc=CAM_ASM_000156
MDATRYLIRGFRARLPIRYLLDSCEELYGDTGWSTRRAQDALVEVLQGRKDLDSYCRSFLRVILTEIDLCPSGRAELSEELVALAAQACSLSGTASDGTNAEVAEAAYEFELDGVEHDAYVFVSSAMSDVHLRVWDAGLFLFECILSKQLDISSKRVVEIGAGAGLNLVALHFAGARSTMLTDRNATAIDNLGRVIERNSASSYACAKVLDLEEDDARRASDFQDADVLIGADITYDPALVKSVVRCYGLFLSADESKNRYGYLAFTVRSSEMVDLLYSELRARGLKYADITRAVEERRIPYLEYCRTSRTKASSEIKLIRIDAS